MKGIVFNLLARVVTEEHGEDAWDDLVDAAGVEAAYTSLGNYPDAELGALVTAASAQLGVPAPDVIRWFGERTLPLFVAAHPAIFQQHASTSSLVRTLNDVIHPEVHKLYPGSSTPSFAYRERADGTLLMEYVSERSLCRFAEGLLVGCVAHYDERVEVGHEQCRLDGDDRCVLRLRPEV